MGIKGLLPALSKIQKKAHISQFKNEKVAIDGFAWLHRAAFSAVRETVAGQVSDRPMKYCLKKAEMIRSHGVTPIFVFDGKSLPSKAETNKVRREAREAAKLESERLMHEGDSRAAYKAMSQAISITWDMVVHLMKTLRREGIDYIVAPYEADAQLGYLSQSGQVSAVISEDSDLLLYGCQKVLFKMDDIGKCISISSADLNTVGIIPKNLYTEDALILLCALSGCDYIDGVKGIGLKKGTPFIVRCMQPIQVEDRNENENKESKGNTAEGCLSPLTPRLRRLRDDLQAAGYQTSSDYELELKRALWTFKYQTVYDPMETKLTRRYALPEKALAAMQLDPSALDFLGPEIQTKLVERYCRGEFNPHSMKETGLEGPVPQNLKSMAPATTRRALPQFDTSSSAPLGFKRSRFAMNSMAAEKIQGKKRRTMVDDELIPEEEKVETHSDVLHHDYVDISPAKDQFSTLHSDSEACSLSTTADSNSLGSDFTSMFNKFKFGSNS